MKKIAVIVSQFNQPITESMFEGAKSTLVEHGYSLDKIDRFDVPGAFELPLMALKAAESEKYDAVLALGCVIKGDTPHFDYVCAEAARGVMDVGLKTKVATVFGVLTTETEEQALLRSGLKNHEKKQTGIKITVENKGVDAANAGLQMLKSFEKLNSL